MSNNVQKLSEWSVRTAGLSLLLIFFTVPHSLEDFSVGEPAKAGVSELPLAFGVAVLLALQGLALLWTGQGKSRGFVLHALLGLLWPLAAGVAQLPVILAPGVYRTGTMSAFFVIGIIVVGVLLFIASIRAWLTTRAVKKEQPIAQ